jgi:hypothetical protein
VSLRHEETSHNETRAWPNRFPYHQPLASLFA